MTPRKAAVELWEKVLELVNLAFTKGEVPQAFCHGILVLIPKGVADQFRGIALLEIIYKLVSSIINWRLAYHDGPKPTWANQDGTLCTPFYGDG